MLAANKRYGNEKEAVREEMRTAGRTQLIVRVSAVEDLREPRFRFQRPLEPTPLARSAPASRSSIVQKIQKMLNIEYNFSANACHMSGLCLG